jgi:hypothetical protein
MMTNIDEINQSIGARTLVKYIRLVKIGINKCEKEWEDNSE